MLNQIALGRPVRYHYCMRILFASGRGYLPDRVDGAIMSVHALFRQLRLRGHACEACAGIATQNRVRTGLYRLRRLLTGRRTAGWADHRNGYPTYRLWDTLIPDLVRKRIAERRPDLVLTQLELCEEIAGAATELRVPTILYVFDAEFEWRKTLPLDSPHLLLISCSRFVAARVRERLGLETPVVYPIVEPDNYRVPGPRDRYVTMVNPVPKKGIDIVLEVARLLPHRRFLLVETWPLTPDYRRELGSRLARVPNVTLRRSTGDMRSVYGETALLLAPSQWEEAFGRVILEAQISGIPVVSSTRGGIPELLEGGGTLLAATDPPEAWAKAVEAILGDPSCGSAMSAAAKANAGRADFDAGAITGRFLEIAAAHISRAGS